MKTKNKLIALMFVVSGMLSMGMSTDALAGDRPNLLIMTEDNDTDSVPRGNDEVAGRVQEAVMGQLHDMGFDVYNETAITMDWEQGRERRTYHELIDIGRSIKSPPIDVVVSYTIYASIKKASSFSKVKARIEGKMVNVNSGKFLGAFEVNSPSNIWTAPKDCNRQCVLDKVGDYSKILANDLGAVLGDKLAYLVDGTTGGADGSGNGGSLTDYNLIFDNFSAGDMADIEEYLVIFSGYKTHRPVYSSSRRSELFYQSKIKSARLNRNLNKMLDEVGLVGQVSFSGNTFTIEQTVAKANKRKPAGDDW